MKISYDLHIHSALSPCAEADMTPGNIVGMAFIKGLDVIAITDHQTCANLKSAFAAAERIRKEQGSAPVILPGMEVECAEGFHMLAFFPTLSAAFAFEEYLHIFQPQIPNVPDIFGEQYLFDENDEISGTVKNLLSTASFQNSIQLSDKIRRAGGCMIPAHVDRESYSILASLGAIPEELPVRMVEISKNCQWKSFLKFHPNMSEYSHIRNSDAHRLADISEPVETLEFPSISEDDFDAEHIVQALREMSVK